MNGKDLLHAMLDVDNAYVAEAAEAKPSRRRMPLWGWLTTAAACLVLIGAVGLVLRPGSDPQGSPVSPLPEDSSLSTDAAEPTGAATAPTDTLESAAGVSGAEAIVVDMDDIQVNENCALLETDYDINRDELFPIMWDTEDLEAYFGWNLVPTYIPAGLIRTEADGCIVAESSEVQVYANAEGCVGDGPDGPIGIDTVSVTYGPGIASSIGAADLVHRHGFTLTASRMDIFCEDFDVFADAELTRGLPEEDIQVTDIGGTDVIFGHIYYGYGPYLADGNPMGYYDIYMAKFSVSGVDYRIIAHDLSLRDVVVLTTDVIWQGTGGYADYSVND